MAISKQPKCDAIAKNADGLFFPQREILNLSNGTFSPGVIAKTVTVAVETKSYQRAEVVLDKVGEIKISARHVGRISKTIGQRLVNQQHHRVEMRKQKSLPIEVKNIPDLAVVQMDGGRIRTRKEGHGSGTHAPAWRESKNALFMRMHSEKLTIDPCPELPDSLQDRSRIRKLVLEMSGRVEGAEASLGEGDSEEKINVRYQGPERLVRTCLSSLDDSKAFGFLMEAEAHRKGFFEAPRQAFVGDGMKCNWTICRKHFPTFTPILDLLHAISYLYHASIAIGETEDFGWGLCLEWTRACWQGRVVNVIEEMAEWLNGQPLIGSCEDVPEDDPRRIVGRALTYLRNNQTRMNYPEYRKQGFPLTSSLMESFVKEMNWRVKGTEKFWNDPSGANPILALKAASLSDDNRIEHLLTTR